MIGQHVFVKAPNGSTRLGLITAHNEAAGTVDLAVFGPSAMVFSPGVPVSSLQDTEPSVEGVMESASAHRAAAAQKALEAAGAPVEAPKAVPAPAVALSPVEPQPEPQPAAEVPEAPVEVPKPSRSRR